MTHVCHNKPIRVRRGSDEEVNDWHQLSGDKILLHLGAVIHPDSLRSLIVSYSLTQAGNEVLLHYITLDLQ